MKYHVYRDGTRRKTHSGHTFNSADAAWAAIRADVKPALKTLRTAMLKELGFAVRVKSDALIEYYVEVDCHACLMLATSYNAAEAVARAEHGNGASLRIRKATAEDKAWISAMGGRRA